MSKTLNKLAILSVVLPIAAHVFNVKKNMNRRDAQMIEIYKRLYPTAGMTDKEILIAALRLTGNQ